MMGKRRYGLRVKIAVGILLPLSAILALLALARHGRYQALLMDHLQSSAANTGEIIEGSLQYAMTTNDFSMLQQIAVDIGRQPGVKDPYPGTRACRTGPRTGRRPVFLGDGCAPTHIRLPTPAASIMIGV